MQHLWSTVRNLIFIQMQKDKWAGAHFLQECQDGPERLTCVPDKWPMGGAIFYQGAVIWTSQHYTSNEVSSQLACQFRRRVKINFQDGNHGSHLGFSIRSILTIFDLQVTTYFLSNFKSFGLSIK